MKRHILLASLGALFAVLSGCTPAIHKAVIDGDYDLLQSMVSREFPSKKAKSKFVNKRKSGTYDTALTEAIKRKDKRMIKLLLENGAYYTDGLTAAAETGDIPMLTFLLEQGVPEKALTPLYVYQAAREGQAEMVKYLTDKGISPEYRNWSGFSSLAVAAENGHRDVVRILIDANADVGYATNYLETQAAKDSPKYANQKRRGIAMIREEVQDSMDDEVGRFFLGY